MTSRAGPTSGVPPVAEELRHDGLRQPLDGRAVRGLRATADGVGHVHHLVPILEGLDACKRQANFGVSAPMISRFFPVVFTASRNAESSKAFIEDRSIGSMASSSDRIDGSVGPLKPHSTPTVERTIGMPNALAVLARSRTCSSTRSA